MLEAGAVEEVEALLARELDPDLPVMRAIGVPEIAAYLADAISSETMIAASAQATRNYAKRQLTWFRRQPPPEWERVYCGPKSENIDIDSYFVSLLRQ
jgi:tRNA dimethylallyltransferase